MYVECTTSCTRAQHGLPRGSALLVLLGCPIGWLMVVVPFRNLYAKFLYQLHQTIGIGAFVLFMDVLFVRFGHGHPDRRARSIVRTRRKAVWARSTLLTHGCCGDCSPRE